MKKKTHGSEEENEFEVDEPEEIQNDASEDDWTPEVDNSRGRRSSRLRNIPKSRAPIIDASSSDEDGSDQSLGTKRKAGGGKGRGRGRGTPAAKKSKVSSSSPAVTPSKKEKEKQEKEEDDDEVEDEEDEDEDDLDNSNENSDSEPSSTTNNSNNFMKVSKDFTSGAFVILKTDAANEDVDPPLWKIDGKALLQKYIPFEQDGKTLYKNTSVYSGWTITNKDNYYPVAVTFKQQTRKEHIVEFSRAQIKKDQPEETEQETESKSTEEKE